MNVKNSSINLVPAVYRKFRNTEYLEGEEKRIEELKRDSFNGLISLVDGLLGKGNLYGESETKFGHYKKSEHYYGLYSLDYIEGLIKNGEFFNIYDFSVEEYITWFCKRMGILLDEGWVTHLDLEGTEESHYFTLDEVIWRLKLALVCNRKRGTKKGLMGNLKIYLPEVDKKSAYVLNGAEWDVKRGEQELEEGADFVIVEDIEDLDSNSVNGKYDFKVTLFYNGTEYEEIVKFMKSTKAIIDRERPIHTRYCYRVICRGWELANEENKGERSILNDTTLLSGDFEVIY